MDTSFLCFAIPCFHGAEVRMRGTFEAREDLTDLERMSDGGYLVVRVWSLFIPHTIEIRSEGGRLTHRYFVGGLSRRYDDEARRLLANELNRLVRQSAFGAATRVRQILAARGPAGVLEEVRTLDNDFVRGTYLRALFAATSLDTATMASAIALVEELFRSDFERSRTLRAVASAAAADVGLARAYVETTDRMSSDFEHARALVALVQGKRPAADVKDLIARSVGRLHSDFEKSRTLRALLAEGPLESPDPVFSAVRGMHSDFEKSRVLRQLLVDRSLPVVARQGVLDVVPSISSDFEQSRVLRAMVDAEPLEPALRSAFLDAADHIGSSFEQNRVLAALVKGEAR